MIKTDLPRGVYNSGSERQSPVTQVDAWYVYADKT